MAKRVNLLQGNITLSIAKLALPLMGMSCLQMAYNLTDMFWIGKLGAGAVAAVGTGGMLVWLSTGIHTIAQLGGQVYVAQNLGAGDTKKAARFAYASMIISVVLCLLMGFAYTVFVDPVIAVFGLNSAEVIEQATTYTMLCCGFILFPMLAKLLTALITTTGDSKTPFKATMIGLVFNMILDPVLIFGVGDIPALGVLGAAIATVLAQAIVLLMLLIHVARDTHLFCFIDYKRIPTFATFKSILKLGFPTAVQGTLFPLFSIYISSLVATFGDNAVAVLRVGSQIESMSWMVTDGYSVAVNSFIAQNFGADNLTRARKGFLQALGILLVYGVLVTAILIIFAKPLFSIFLSEPEILQMGIDYLIILGVSQLFLCTEILSGSAMNACGKTLLPSFVSSVFTFCRIPLAIFLSATALGLCGIWWAITLTTVAKGSVLLVAVLYCFHKLCKNHTAAL